MTSTMANLLHMVSTNTIVPYIPVPPLWQSDTREAQTQLLYKYPPLKY